VVHDERVEPTAVPPWQAQNISLTMRLARGLRR
jgi:hypothetical protein